MHTIWKGSIQFGLVSIPVKLHTATDDKDISFRSLHEECHSPIKYVKTCPVCDREVGNDEIVKGYEVVKGKYVIVTDEDLQPLKKALEDQAVEIVEFIEINEIDPIYFDKTYFLSPNEGGKKAYTLLHQALKDSGKVGIGKIILRSKEKLAVIRPYEKTLLMETIHYPDEIRSANDVPNVPENLELTKKEVDMAKLLIEQLTNPFEPTKYVDEYREQLLQLIENKKTGMEVVAPTAERKEQPITDLMAALQASIDRTKPEAKPKRTRRKTTAKAKKAT
ncbi:Ku protein [Aeribacillus pallidus]|jgi:DNA end-binding protein Ku|uniref:non-homologous end joining protein Ku n=1 Tax=Aeribacillus pallidus TaxID=33936 RepID=UPI003D1C7FB3